MFFNNLKESKIVAPVLIDKVLYPPKAIGSVVFTFLFAVYEYNFLILEMKKAIEMKMLCPIFQT